MKIILHQKRKPVVFVRILYSIFVRTDVHTALVYGFDEACSEITEENIHNRYTGKKLHGYQKIMIKLVAIWF